MSNRILLWLLASSCLGLAGGCGGGDGGGVKSAFERFQTTTRFSYAGAIPLSNTGTAMLGVIGDKDIGGVTYQRYKVGLDVSDPAELGNPATRGPEVWMTEKSRGRFAVAGVSATLDDLSATLDTPLEFDAGWKTGETQNLTLTGTSTSASFPQPTAFRLAIQGAVTEDDATASTLQGTFSGCRRFEGHITIEQGTIPGLANDTAHAVEAWYHPTLGIVSLKMPAANLDAGLGGEEDYGSAASGENTIRKVRVLANDQNRFELSTADRAGEWDADKDSHAKMLLELRWAGEQDAREHPAPDPLLVRVTFGTFGGMFYFPHQLVESPVSIFHPEENGRGYKYWYAYVDEGAKNQPENGITYDIIVEKDPSLPPLRVSARIRYRIWTP